MSDSGHHVVSLKTYVGVFAALLILTGITVWVAFQHLGDPWNDVIALGIAVTKATLVGLFFMHLRYATRMPRLAVVAAVIWLLFLLVLTIQDFLSRGWLGVAGK